MQNELYRKLIRDKRVIFVCPSPILQGSGLGEWIDGFDVIIRTNNFCVVSPELQKDYGSRTDVLYVNNQFSKETHPFPVQDWLKVGLKWLCFKSGIFSPEYYGQFFKTKSSSKCNKEIISYLKSPLTGSIIVHEVSNYKPKEFFVAGMNFYNGKILDWENVYIPGYLPNKILIPSLKKRAEGYFNESNIHDTEANKKFILEYYKEGKIDFDDFTKEAIGLKGVSLENIPSIGFLKKPVYVNPLENLMPRRISIRNSANAKKGLQDFCDACKNILEGVEKISILEIGSYAGDAAEIFARNFDKVFCVDPWLGGYDSTDAASSSNMLEVEKQFDDVKAKYPNIEKYKIKSVEASNLFDDESLEIVYIDGLHTYPGVKADIEAWLPKVKTGFLLGGHDYQNRFSGTIKAIKELLGEVKVFSDTSWLWVKK